MHRASETITELADKIVGAVPRFDAIGQKMAVALYRLLSEGDPVPLNRLADVVALPADAVRDTLAKWPVFFDDKGAVIGFGGLTVVEMPPHRFVVDGRSLYTWCAWDSLFIPGVLGKPARVESVCPVTKEQISLEVGPDGVRRVDPPTVVVSFLTPDRTFDRNVIVNFCHFVHFFRSAEVAASWILQHPGTFLLSIDEAFALGQLTNARNFGEALSMHVDAMKG
ncbi:MAG: organomercurial lyase [Armatimonadota bacterium]